MQDRCEIELKLISDPMYLCGARELVSCIARRIGFDDMDCSKISLAVDEALSNVIRHGYNRSFDKPIWLGISPLKADDDSIGGIRIQIDDEAKQVDPCKMKGRDLQDVKPGGLGLHIISEVMDEVSHDRRSEKGMRMVMIKRAIKSEESARLSETRGISCPVSTGSNAHARP